MVSVGLGRRLTSGSLAGETCVRSMTSSNALSVNVFNKDIIW